GLGVTEPAAQADDAPRQCSARNAPAGFVDLVDALIADVAVAEIPEPVPAVVNQVVVVGLFLGRPQPDVEVQFGRRSLGRRITYRRPRVAAIAAEAALVTEAARHEQLAVFARLDYFQGARNFAVAAALGAV